MNVMRAFMLGTSGRVTDAQMNHYHHLVHDNYQQVKNMGGAIGAQADNFYGGFVDFVNSRDWELSTYLVTGDENSIGRFSIGRIKTLDGLRNAQTTMRDYIMAMPGVMNAYQAGHLEGYGGDIAAWCNGEGDDNLFYRRQMHGVVGFREHESKQQAYHKHYHDSVASTHLSSKERFDLAATRHTVNHYLAAKAADFTSSEGNDWIKDPKPKD